MQDGSPALRVRPCCLCGAEASILEFGLYFACPILELYDERLGLFQKALSRRAPLEVAEIVSGDLKEGMKVIVAARQAAK